jgi:hypothetical protein
MAVLYSNNASSALSASITSTTTSFSVTANHGVKFPAISGGDYFYVTLLSTGGAIEIVRVTARSVDTFTVVRGQDGTTGTAFSAGDKVEARITKALLDDFKTDTRFGYLPLSGGTLTGDLTVTRLRATHSLVLNTYTTVNPSSNVFLYSQGNDRDSWLYLDSADTGSNWGVYHRQIDSAVSGLPGNSIGFVGGGNSALKAYISLMDGSANFAGALTQAGNQVLHAGNYTSYSPSLTGSGASGTWGVRVTGFANAGSPRLYSTDASYNYDSTNPYYGYLSFDGTRWLFQVSPGTPAAVRVAYSDSAGSVSGGLTTSNYSSYALPLSGGTLSGALTVTGGSNSIIAQDNNGAGDWRGRILSKNSTYDRAAFLGTYAGNTGVFAHNHALTAWADLYINTTDGSGGGTVRMPASVLVNGSQVLHAGNFSSYASPIWYQGWVTNPGWDANALPESRSGFTYSNNAPLTGPVVHFGAGGYGLQLNSNYGGATDLRFRARNGDTGAWNGWRVALSDNNYNSYAPTLTGVGASGTNWNISITGSAAQLGGVAASNYFRTDGTYPNADMNSPVEGYWHVISGASGAPEGYYGHRWDYDHLNNGQWVAQMYSPTSGDAGLWFRQRRDFAWQGWRKFLDSSNVSSYAHTISTNPNVAGPGVIAIGNQGSYSFVQSHNGQPLNLNPAGNTVQIAGNVALHAGNYTSYAAAASHNQSVTTLSDRPDWFGGGSYIGGHSNANDWRNSGFYENGGGGSNWPSGTWYNSINVRHSNQGNYHGFQVAMGYYDNNLWFRSYQGSGTFQSWAYALSTANYSSFVVPISGGSFTGKTNFANGSALVSSFVGAHGQYGKLIELQTPGGGGQDGAQIWFHKQNAKSWGVGVQPYGSNGWAIYEDGSSGTWGTERMRIDPGGNAIFNQNVTAYSDERWKKEWTALPSDFIERLAAVKSGTYTRIDSGERQAGSSAQDWQKLLPEVVVVGADDDKTLSLAYGNAALVSAVELAKDNVELRARIERLEYLISTLIGD